MIKVIIGILILLSSAQPASSQELGDQLVRLQSNAKIVLAETKRMVTPHLTPEEKLVQESVAIHVPVDPAATARAYPGYIEISAGLVWLLDVLAIVNVADYELGFDGCSHEYSRYLLALTLENTNRVRKEHPPHRVLHPAIYGQVRRGYCYGFELEMIDESGSGDYYASLVEASLVFLYLHELGHHVLGHIERPPRSLTDSRRDEAEADAWAIEVGFRADYNVLAGAPIANFIVGLGGRYSEDEVGSSHPLGMRRARDWFAQAKDILADRGEQDVLKWVEAMLAETEGRMRDIEYR